MVRMWEQRPEEPDRAYALFQCYLDLGPGRSLRKLAETGAASLPHLKALSSRWRWRERGAAWQAELAGAGAASPGDAIQEMRDRQLRDARMLRRLARVQIQRHLAEGRRSSGYEVARMWEMGFRAEHHPLPLAPSGEETAVEPTGGRRGAQRLEREPEEPDPNALREARERRTELLALAREAGLSEERLPEIEPYLEHLFAGMLQMMGELRPPEQRQSSKEEAG